MKQYKGKAALFFSGFIMVFFVAINTVFLSKEVYIGVAFSAFAISIIWSFNVKKVAFGTLSDRLVYAGGATIGSLSGLYLSQSISELILKII